MIGYIYKITSEQTDKCYVGSTINDINHRFSKHKCCYKKYIDGNYCYITSFEVLQYGDAKIDLIDEIQFEDKKELIDLETKYIRELNSVNKRIENRTNKEYQKQYHQEHKDKLNQQKKQYRQDNRDKLSERHKQYYNKNKDELCEKRKQKITCECGSICSIYAISRHKRTKKHLDYIK